MTRSVQALPEPLAMDTWAAKRPHGSGRGRGIGSSREKIATAPTWKGCGAGAARDGGAGPAAPLPGAVRQGRQTRTRLVAQGEPVNVPRCGKTCTLEAFVNAQGGPSCNISNAA